jgi:hypothetical protein
MAWMFWTVLGAVPEPAVGEQRLAEGVELRRGELLERDRAERR